MNTLVTTAVNASLPIKIDLQTLVDCLASRRDPAPWIAHLAVFFTELRVEVIEQFLAEHGISEANAARVYERVRQATGDRSDDFERWLGYLAAPPP
jgi:fructosamine-3-kinase